MQRFSLSRTLNLQLHAEIKLFYISVGEHDARTEYTKKAAEKFKESGLKVEFASFLGAHEWQVWRKPLHEFAQKVFK